MPTPLTYTEGHARAVQAVALADTGEVTAIESRIIASRHHPTPGEWLFTNGLVDGLAGTRCPIFGA